MTITETIRDALSQSGMTQTEIATAAGVSQRSVSDFLRGTGCNSATLDAFAELCGLEFKKNRKAKT